MNYLPVGLDSIANVNANVVRNALFFLFSFISNILCEKQFMKTCL